MVVVAFGGGFCGGFGCGGGSGGGNSVLFPYTFFRLNLIRSFLSGNQKMPPSSRWL